MEMTATAKTKGYIWERRLVEEIKQLAKRLNNLNLYMSREYFFVLDRKQKDLIYEQQRVTPKHLQMLGKRTYLEKIQDKLRRFCFSRKNNERF